MTVTITRADPQDAALIKLRDADLLEVQQWSPGRDPVEVVKGSILISQEAYTGWIGDEVVAIGGWSFDGPSRISPWLLGSDLLIKHRKELMRTAYAFIHTLRKEHPDKMLCNHVAKANGKARLFLTGLGFTIVPSPGSGEFDFFYILPCVNQQP